MGNRNWPQSRIYNQHFSPRQLDAQIAIGASGAPTLSTSNGNAFGIKSITRLSAGRYRIQLQDNYNALLQFQAQFQAGLSGSDIAVDATTVGLSVGTVYQITAVGTATTAANWITLGVPAGITPAVGVNFKAATTGTGTQSGAGTVKVISTSGIAFSELMENSSSMLSNQPFVFGNGGGYIDFQTMGGVFTAAAYTPAGTISAPTFTGDALATHTHSIPAGTDSGGGTSGATSGGTPAGTISAPVFTGTAASLTGTVSYAPADPANGSTMYVKILVSDSSVQ